MAALPLSVRQQLDAIRREYTNGEITTKGFRLRLARTLGPFASDECYDPSNDGLLEAVALQDHVAKTPRELMFLKDDVLTVLARLPNNMYKGECQGFVGLLNGSDVRFLSVPWWEKQSPRVGSSIATSSFSPSASTPSSPMISASDVAAKVPKGSRRTDDLEPTGRYVVNPGPLSYERAPMYEPSPAKLKPRDDPSAALLSSSPSKSSEGKPKEKKMTRDTSTDSEAGLANAKAVAAALAHEAEVDVKKKKKEREAAEASAAAAAKDATPVKVATSKRDSKEKEPKEKEPKEKETKDKEHKEAKEKEPKEPKEPKEKEPKEPKEPKDKESRREHKSKEDKESKSKDKDSEGKKKVKKADKEKEKEKDDKDTSSLSSREDDESERKARRKAKKAVVILPVKDKKPAATAVAIRDHIAENDNELMFLQGELIKVIERRGNGVYLGHCEGADGIFYEQDVVFEGPNRAIMSDEVQRSYGPSVPKESPAAPQEREVVAALANLTIIRNAPASNVPSASSVAAAMSASPAPLQPQASRGELLAELRKKRSASDEQLQFFRRSMSKTNIKLKYHKLERIGTGSFGEVFKALDQETGEIVAIKVVDLEDRRDELQELQKEIAFMAQFVSKYVTRYFGSYVVERQLWIIMEYLAGGSMFDMIRSGPMDERSIAIVMREVLRGLQYLHGQRKLHRDIKAANILLSDNGDVKLCDFGVAGQLTDSLTRKNTFTGTPAWMAPEVILNAGYDMRADIWSLGITAIELADGLPPNASLHPMRILYLIVSNPPPTMNGGGYSEAFKDFVAKCLQKDPKKRATSEQLLEHPFIKRAGDTHLLTELISRHQQWLASRADSKDADDTSSEESPEHYKSWDFD